MLIEADANLVTQAHYTDFPGEWGGLSSERRGIISSFYGFDQQSNTRILVSIGGNITDNYLYKSFGEELAVSGNTVNSLRFGGQVGYYRDLADRLYVRARHLRADLGRWMSRDTIGFKGGDWNLYRYVGNRPVVKVDPSGLWSCHNWAPPSWCRWLDPPAFHAWWCDGCKDSCVMYCNDTYINKNGPAWDNCLKWCNYEYVRCIADGYNFQIPY